MIRKQKALLLETIHPAAREAFEATGFKVELFPHDISTQKLIERLQDAQVLGVRS